MGCATAAELAGLVPEFGLVVLVLRAVRTVTDGPINQVLEPSNLYVLI
jgi:hypothetical protein